MQMQNITLYKRRSVMLIHTYVSDWPLFEVYIYDYLLILFLINNKRGSNNCTKIENRCVLRNCFFGRKIMVRFTINKSEILLFFYSTSVFKILSETDKGRFVCYLFDLFSPAETRFTTAKKTRYVSGNSLTCEYIWRIIIAVKSSFTNLTSIQVSSQCWENLYKPFWRRVTQ